MGTRAGKRGFTLIEMAIVLVVIGLLVGGILYGKDLINSAAMRAQISQMERFNTAVNTFYTKYGALPGDMQPTPAAQFGFNPGTGCDGVSQGWRDGNGKIEGWPGLPYSQTVGETIFFWQDLGTAHLIENPYSANASCATAMDLNLTSTGSSNVASYFPAAKIGLANFVYVYAVNGFNWFGVSAITSVDGYGGVPTSAATIPAGMAANIDKKIDDGMPTTGRVQAVYLTTGGSPSTVVQTAPNAASDGALTCYNTTTNVYSTAYNNGNGANCALSFKMQAGD